MDGTKAWLGLGSHSKELMDSKSLDMVIIGDHWDLRISTQIYPFRLILGW